MKLRPARYRLSRMGAARAAAVLVATALTAAVAIGGWEGRPATPADAGTPAGSGAPAQTIEQHRIHGTRFRSDGKVTAPPKVTMRAWAIADMDTGTILAVHAYRQHLPEASTLKLLTAVTASFRVPARSHQVSYAEAHPAYCTCAGLIPGKWYRRSALLTGMLLPSGNDAAEAIAGADPHGRAAFIAAMNRRALRLGATDTHAANPSGLTAAGAYSSARDLLILLRAAQANRLVEPYLEKLSGQVGPVRGPMHTVYRGTEYVNLYPTAQGKSGFTTPAGNTLVVSTPIATPLGVRRIGVATLGAPGGRSVTGTRRLTEWAAANYPFLTGVATLPPAPGPVVGAQAAYVPSTP